MEETSTNSIPRYIGPSERPTSKQRYIGSVLSIGTLILTGIVLSVLWRWFIVPLGVPAIGKSHGVGIVTIVMLLVFVVVEKPRERTRSEFNDYLTRSIALEVISAITALIIGAVAHFFM